MKDLVFIAYVFGDYSKYIPYYIFSIRESYPEYYVKIFLNKKLNDIERKALSLIHSDNYEIVEDFKSGNDKFYRWLIPYEELKGFKYAYFGDIDILIKREYPSLLDSHVQHMKNTNLPYSNAIRKKDDKRLTGLHFIEVSTYYDKMSNIINSFVSNGLDKNRLPKYIQRNEHFLYYLIEKQIGFGDYKIKEGAELFYRPHHGLHLGLLRYGNKEQIWKESHNYFLTHIPECIYDSVIDEILKILPLNEIQFVRNKIREEKIVFKSDAVCMSII